MPITIHAGTTVINFLLTNNKPEFSILLTFAKRFLPFIRYCSEFFFYFRPDKSEVEWHTVSIARHLFTLLIHNQNKAILLQRAGN